MAASDATATKQHIPPRTASLADAATMPADDVLQALDSSSDGLSSDEARARLARVGPNALRSHGPGAIAVLVGQLRNPFLLLLLGTAIASAFFGERTDAIIIFLISGLSVGLGFVSEYRSTRAVEALHSQLRHTIVALRDGAAAVVDVTEVVPGDVVRVGVGDVVPADLRLLEAQGLECDESVLTGESAPAEKNVEPVTKPESPLELPSCAFMGTVVRAGSGVGVVVQTGGRAEFGKIATKLGERQPQTAFQLGLRDFSILLVRFAGALSVTILVVNLALGRPVIQSLLFALSISIGLTPQLLPAIVSVSLSTGARRLAQRKVIVKRLVAIEDFGNIDVFFTDKTGTLTEGRISFAAALDATGAADEAVLRDGLLCSDAIVDESGAVVGGPALDQALWTARGAHTVDLASYRRLAERPFDYERRLASVLVEGPDETRMVIVKGAPELVLARCRDLQPKAQSVLDAEFARGSRVVAVATRDASGKTTLSPHDEDGLELAGFLTFVDPPKADAADAIARLHELGVEVKVITGDNDRVASKVCGDLALPVRSVLTGTQLDALDDDALAAALPQTTVFARVTPEQKSRVINAQRTLGSTVGFMGDGVNDAVALHDADVGISVDSATDVAKDAADIVLLEKDLDILATGIGEGRRIFTNTIKYVLDGDLVELREHVQRRRRLDVPRLPAAAADADPAQQPPLRHEPDHDPDRQRRRGANAPARALGHRHDPALHALLRADQLALRLRHLRDPAARLRREPHRSSAQAGSSSRSRRRASPSSRSAHAASPSSGADRARRSRVDARRGGDRLRAAVLAARATRSGSRACRRASSLRSRRSFPCTCSCWSSRSECSTGARRPGRRRRRSGGSRTSTGFCGAQRGGRDAGTARAPRGQPPRGKARRRLAARDTAVAVEWHRRRAVSVVQMSFTEWR